MWSSPNTRTPDVDKKKQFTFSFAVFEQKLFLLTIYLDRRGGLHREVW